jgi:hypothetical protein
MWYGTLQRQQQLQQPLLLPLLLQLLLPLFFKNYRCHQYVEYKLAHAPTRISF